MEKMPVSASQPLSLDFSLESLNKLNQSSSSSLYPDTGSGGRRADCYADGGKSGESCFKGDEASSSSSFTSRPGVDPVGSLSDSLYDSFSSCTSQGSNEVWKSRAVEMESSFQDISLTSLDSSSLSLGFRFCPSYWKSCLDWLEVERHSGHMEWIFG